MAVIAMTREMGTLGKDIAYGLAESLDHRIVHHELIEHDVAERLGVQESAVHHYLEGSASMLERWRIDSKKLSRYTAVEVLELAQGGNIIIRGWGRARAFEGRAECPARSGLRAHAVPRESDDAASRDR